jgi:hypothetical protein
MRGTSALVHLILLERVCIQSEILTTGAGFYLNATHPKYSKHYNMATHVSIELPQIIEASGLPIVCFSLVHLLRYSSLRSRIYLVNLFCTS